MTAALPETPAAVEGADPDESTEDTTTESTESTESTTDSTDWKAQSRKHERAAKANAEAARELAALKAKDQTESQRLSTERDAATTRATAMLQRAVKAEVRSAAAGLKFRDSSDAMRLLDLDDLTDDEGEVDTDQVTAALQAIATAKPYLLDADPVPPGRSGNPVTGTGDLPDEGSVEAMVARLNK